MDPISNEIISLLSYLLPGFIAAWVYYGITAYSKPSQFERVVQALIYTVIVQVGVNIVQGISSFIGHHVFSLGIWTKNSALGWSIFLAFLIGLIFARYANNDKIHSILRKWSFTVATSHPSEWFGVFSQNKTYVVLHLKDDRRLYGWPEEWPSQPNTGHFSITEAEWLSGEKNENRIMLESVSNILIPAQEVVFVEFMKLIENKKGE